MTVRAAKVWRGDDSGASLVLALVFVSVVALVVAAVLTFTDTSIRVTMALREQAAVTAAADAAADIAINTLRESTYAGDGNCWGTVPELSLPSSVFPNAPEVVSASVACQADSASDEFPLGTPAQAILTVATGTIDGLAVLDNNSIASPAAGVRVNSNVYSNSRIFVGAEANLTALSGGVVRARTGCTLQTITVPFVGTFRGTITPNPTTAQCNVATAFACPQCETPSTAALAAQAPQAVPACAAIMTFAPGRYTDLAALNHRTENCRSGSAILHFTPGVYFFDFPPIGLIQSWEVERGSIVAGALAPGVVLPASGAAPAMPGACKSPVPTGSATWVPPSPDEGVTFIFSGYSRMQVTASARVEICGRYAGTKAPLAIFAQQTSVLGLNCDDQTVFPCAALRLGSLLFTSPPAAFHLQGTLFAPTRELVARLHNDGTSTQRYNGGVVARRVWINTSRSTTAPAVFSVPTSDPFTARRTFVRLEVRVCPGQATCTGGAVRLRARVLIRDAEPGGLPVAGAREITVLNWTVVR
jgi:hypothetical protein